MKLLIVLFLVFLLPVAVQAQGVEASKIRKINFAQLGTPISGQVRYVRDGTAGSPCTGSGSGAWAYANGSSWICTTQAPASGGATIPSTTNLIKGDGAGNGADSGIVPANVLQSGGALGTPSSGVATNLTGTAAGLTAGTASAVAVGGITGLGTGVGAALAVNVGSAGAPVLFNGALGTPSSGTLTSATGLPISTGLTGAGTEVLTALGVNIGSAGSFVVNGGALGSPSSAGTIPAFTLGGTVAGGGNQLNNVIIGTSTPLAGTFTTGVFGSTTSLLLGTAGSAVGNIGFRNATSGTATLAPPTGALGSYSVTLPNAASTLPIFGQQITFAGPTAARTVTFPDAAFTAARTDAGQTFTGVNTFTSPKIITDLSDTNGNELFKVTATGSAVNEFTVANAATANNPTLSATGGDTNIGMTFTPKGSGGWLFKAGSATVLFEVKDSSNNLFFSIDQAASQIKFRSDIVDQNSGGGTYDVVVNSGRMLVGPSGSVEFRATSGGSVDTQITRNAAGVVQFGTTAANALGSWAAVAGTLSSATAPITFSNAAYQSCTALTTSAGGVLGCTASTAKVKQGFKLFYNGLEAVRFIQPQTFSYRPDSFYADGGKKHLGLIAENLQQANPLLVSSTGAGVLQPEPMALHAIEIDALKALDARITVLEHENKRLRSLLSRRHR